MEIDQLKLSFFNYLKENQTEQDNKIGEFSDFSIFSYVKEFKEFLTDEFHATTDDLSMDVSDLLNLEIENGKIITDENDNTNDGKNDDLMVDVLNLMFEDEEFKDKFDTDSNGEINKEEFESFLEKVKDIDKNENNFSIDDLVGSAEIEDEATEATEPTAPAEDPSIDSPGGGGGGGGGIDGAGNVDGPASSSNTNLSNDTSSADSALSLGDESSSKDYENMSVEELTQALSQANADLQTKESELSAIQNGTDSNIAAAKGAMDDALEAYTGALEELEDEDADKLAEAVEKVEEYNNQKTENEDRKNAAIDARDQANTDVDTYASEIETCEGQISSLQAQISTWQASMNLNEDEEDAGLQELIQNAEAQIEALEAQKEEAEANKAEAEERVVQAEAEIAEAEEAIANSEQDITSYEETREELEDKILEDHEDIAELKTAYDTAKTEYETAKETAITEAQQAVDDVRDRIAEIQAALDTAIANEQKAIEDKYPEDEIKVDEEIGSDFIDEILANDPEKTEETEDSEEPEKPEGAEGAEEESEETKKEDKIDELCELLDMDRDQVGIYLKNISNESGLSAKDLYEKISDYIEFCKEEKDQVNPDVLKYYHIDEDKANEYIEDYNTRFGTSYDLESLKDNPAKMFELLSLYGEKKNDTEIESVRIQNGIDKRINEEKEALKEDLKADDSPYKDIFDPKASEEDAKKAIDSYLTEIKDDPHAQFLFYSLLADDEKTLGLLKDYFNDHPDKKDSFKSVFTDEIRRINSSQMYAPNTFADVIYIYGEMNDIAIKSGVIDENTNLLTVIMENDSNLEFYEDIKALFDKALTMEEINLLNDNGFNVEDIIKAYNSNGSDKGNEFFRTLLDKMKRIGDNKYYFDGTHSSFDEVKDNEGEIKSLQEKYGNDPEKIINAFKNNDIQDPTVAMYLLAQCDNLNDFLENASEDQAIILFEIYRTMEGAPYLELLRPENPAVPVS